ncbi:MAG: tyrosine-type recombinase/integrase [Desulfovibrio sp.]|nr:tyrosine-type recombinase/integrase [Desulfovibrio sp.]
MPYQEKNGKWRATKMIAGKRKTKHFATKAEAKKWEARQSSEDWQKEEETPTVCWIDFLTACLDHAKERFSTRTFNEKKLAFKRALAVIPARQAVEKTTVAQAMEIMRSVARTSSGNAANKARKNLCAAWEWGKLMYGLSPVNPFKEALRMPADATPRYVPPEEDFWKVYDACERQSDRVLLLFLLHTGARIQEAFRLVWSDVDFERRQIRLGTRKTASRGMEYAWIPMTGELMDALEEHKINSRTLNVFVSQAGKPMTHRQHFMKQACERAGVQPFGFHGIRHLTATILAHAGLDLPSVQAILRHHNPTTTARYIQSLGVQPNKLDVIFSDKKRSAKVSSFSASE